MCGIAGSLGARQESEASLRRMAAALSHRGPDDEGVWLDEARGVGLVHRRLSIIDLSPAGHQPMSSVDGRYVIVYNGEIYNHLELRAELESQSDQRWRGHSDTETLLAGFCAWGIEATLRRARGMFAMAVWDRQDRALTLARDRLGEKPLYYGSFGGALLFSSEIKAMRVHSAFRAEIDPDALAAFMRYSYVPAPQSIYRGVRKLIPGTLLCFPANNPDEPKCTVYWSLLDVVHHGMQEPFEGSPEQALHQLHALLADAVSAQQISDVPIGAFLSGGVDSSLIVALMQAQASRPVRTFTIGFESERYNEAVHARAVAKHLGTEHAELIVTPGEARSVIPLLPSIYDEPFADASQIPTYLVSRLARREVTVSLSGDAGDELFGGYNRYLWATKLAAYPLALRVMLSRSIRLLTPSTWNGIHDMLRPILPRSLRFEMAGDKAHKLAAILAERSVSSIYAGLVSTWTSTNSLVLQSRAESLPGDQWRRVAQVSGAEQQMMALDALTYLPDDVLCKVDRAAMAVSLETRVPYLDHRVVEFAWRLPLGLKIRAGDPQGKWILRQLLYRYVPRELIERPKMGFGVPIDAWLRGPLRAWAEGLLEAARLRSEEVFDPELIREKWTEHLSGRRNWQYPLWNVLMFQAWQREQRA